MFIWGRGRKSRNLTFVFRVATEEFVRLVSSPFCLLGIGIPFHTLSPSSEKECVLIGLFPPCICSLKL